MMGGVGLASVLAALASPASPPLSPWAGWVFHLNAVLNVVAVIAAFRVMEGGPRALRSEPSAATAAALLRRYVLLAAGLMGVSALVAAAAAWGTGEWINLAFAVPFFGVVGLVYPTGRRVRAWSGRDLA